MQLIDQLSGSSYARRSYSLNLGHPPKQRKHRKVRLTNNSTLINNDASNT